MKRKLISNIFIILYSFILFASILLLCSCDEENNIYISNTYFVDEIFYINSKTNEKHNLSYDENNLYYYGKCTDNTKIKIFGRKDNQDILITETTYKKELPYFYYDFQSSSSIPSNIVFIEKHELNSPYLIYEINNETKSIPMYIYPENTNLLYGYLENGVNTYSYSNLTNTFEYTSSNILFNGKLINIDEFIQDFSYVYHSDTRVFFKKPDYFTNVYYYLWNDSKEDIKWPGRLCNKENDLYYFDNTNSYKYCIFNNGKEIDKLTTQTENITISDKNGLFKPVYNLETESFYDYYDNRFNDLINTNLYNVYFKPDSTIKSVDIIYFTKNKLNTKEMTLNIDTYEGSIPINCDYFYFSYNNFNTLKFIPNQKNNLYSDNKWIKKQVEILNPDKAPETIYNDLFNINNKIIFKIDISESELNKIENDYQLYSKMGSKSPIYRMCDFNITIENDNSIETYFINQVGIRMKGNTSRTSFYDQDTGIFNLINYKLKFNETFDDEDDYLEDELVTYPTKELKKERKNRTFATLEGLELKWNKNFDGTHVRTYLAYDLFTQNDYLAPESNVCDVMITNKGKLENLGLFDFNEPIDEVFLSKHLSEDDLGGDLYKVGWDHSNGGSLTMNTLYSIGLENEKENLFYVYDLKTNKKTSNHDSLINLINALDKNQNINDLVQMDMFIKFMSISYMLGNPDDYRNNYNNYYIYFLKSNKKAIFIPYDLDRCLGITKDWDPYGYGSSKVDPLYKYTVTGNEVNPIVRNILNNKDYRNKYINTLNSLCNQYFSYEYFLTTYNIVSMNYSYLCYPTIQTIKNKGINFTLSDTNYNINDYYNNIKANIIKIN